MPVPMTGGIVTRRRLGRSARHHPDQLSSTTKPRPPSTVVACSGSESSPGSPAANRHSTAILACLTRASSPEAFSHRLTTLAGKTPSCHHSSCASTTASLTKRSARPNAAARRQLHFGLQLCHTVAALPPLPAWYYTPRMHACMHAAYYAGHTQTGTASTA